MTPRPWKALALRRARSSKTVFSPPHSRSCPQQRADGRHQQHDGSHAGRAERSPTPAVGIANAYDAMHLTALAIKNAGTTKGPDIRQGFYAIGKHEGLIKTYEKPFTPEVHDALGPNDYVFTRFIKGEIIPISVS